MNLMKCPVSGLMLPRKFIDEKQSLKKSIEDLVDKAVNHLQHVKEDYFLVFHAKFNDRNEFRVDPPEAATKLPPFCSNQLVYWICNKRGIKELLWMVAPVKKGEKLKVEFNKSGVAYLQAQGAMSKKHKPS